MKLYGAVLGFALLAAGAIQAQDMDIQVELLGPLATQTSQKGDKISARVLTPDALRGDIVEGKVTEVKQGNKLKGQAVLNFTFETLNHGGEAVPLATQIRSFANSKGQQDVDEEGRVIKKKSNLGKAAGGTIGGAVLGGILGGAKGAAIGAAAGAATSIVLIQVAAEGPSVRFDAGSRVWLSAKSRSGPALASLSPNPPSAEAPPAAAEAPAEQPAPAQEVQAAPAQQEAPAPAEAPAAAQPNFKALKDDFIPGEKVLLYDDFTDMAADEAPPHWKVRGASLSLEEAGDMRQISVVQKSTLQPMITQFPKNFTLEATVQFDKSGRQGWWFYPDGSEDYVLEVWTEDRADSTQLRVYVRSKDEMLNDSEVAVDLSRPVKHDLWIQNGRLRFYLNGKKVVDVNQVELPPLKRALLEATPSDGSKFHYRLFRIGESTPDFSQTIASTGRYITHGIYFDTGSDQLKTESGAVLKQIAAGLQKNPNLKLRIEGHTDSVGNEASNLDLSKRRAEAVKAVLVSQFGVDAARLTSNGLGAGKPMDSNDTPQGRAQNRRVEFVKQ
jgi:OOP family OmpA-OmpF porin